MKQEKKKKSGKIILRSSRTQVSNRTIKKRVPIVPAVIKAGEKLRMELLQLAVETLTILREDSGISNSSKTLHEREASLLRTHKQ